MPERQYAKVVPIMLKWAREEAGYTLLEVATYLRVHEENVVSWETGLTAPTISQARKLANQYKRSLSVFYLPTPPQKMKLPTDYRRADGAPAVYPPRLRFELRRALYRRDKALEMLEDLEEKPQPFLIQAKSEESPQTVAERIRKALAIDLETQLRWNNNDNAFKAWRSAIEAQGALVFQTGWQSYGVSVSEMRGVALYYEIFPIILVNGRDVSTGKIFSLLHELTHLALHTEGICDYRDTKASIEVFCNAVAGEVLIPKESLEHYAMDIKSPGYDLWTDELIAEIAFHYHVSRDTAARRLHTIGQISREFYQQKHLKYTEDYVAEKESKRNSKSQNSGGPRPSTTCLIENGRPYTSLVIDAYSTGLITVSEASRFLGITHPHIPEIARTLRASSRGAEW